MYSLICLDLELVFCDCVSISSNCLFLALIILILFFIFKILHLKLISGELFPDLVMCVLVQEKKAALFVSCILNIWDFHSKRNNQNHI